MFRNTLERIIEGMNKMENETILYEKRITSFLDGPDNSQITNIVHSSEGAKQFGFNKPLIGGVTVYSWAVGGLIEVRNPVEIALNEQDSWG